MELDIRRRDLRDLQLVQLGPDTVAPQRFGIVIGWGELELELDIELDDDHKPRCRALTVRDGDVTTETLREIPVAKVAQAALEATVWIYEEVPEGGIRMPLFPEPAERERMYEQAAEGGRRPRRGSPVTKETLTQVAELYRTAVANNDPPTQTVADAMHASRSTAARWVSKARKAKLLGPAMRGRAGEAS
jgi:Family of unknown function (DUF6214)